MDKNTAELILRPTNAIEMVVKAAMQRSGSQKNLGEKLGVRPGTVSLWLRGVCPSAKNLRRLEDFLSTEGVFNKKVAEGIS